jgi:hypothetical protein
MTMTETLPRSQHFMSLFEMRLQAWRQRMLLVQTCNEERFWDAKLLLQRAFRRHLRRRVSTRPVDTVDPTGVDVAVLRVRTAPVQRSWASGLLCDRVFYEHRVPSAPVYLAQENNRQSIIPDTGSPAGANRLPASLRALMRYSTPPREVGEAAGARSVR